MIEKRKADFKIKVGDILLYNRGAMTEWHLVVFVGDDKFKTYFFKCKDGVAKLGFRDYRNLGFWLQEGLFRKLENETF